MVYPLTEIKKENYSQNCFPVMGKRTALLFKPYAVDADQKADVTKCDWAKQVFKGNSVADLDAQTLKITKGPIPAKYRTTLAATESSKDDLRRHLDKRIQLFFQQVILCYNTPFTYDAKCAEDQVGQGGTIKHSNTTYRSEAAHSSTLACLHAYLKKTDGTTDKSHRFVFLKHSSTYDYHNSTEDLVRAANRADILIDKTLRSEALKIINKVAKAQLQPVKATRLFIKRLKKKLNNLTVEKKGDARGYICQIHLDHLEDIETSLLEDHDMFDHLMGINVSATKNQQILRDVVYKTRFKLIQETQHIESKIARRILKAENIIKKARCKSLKNVDSALRVALLHDAKYQPLQRKQLERLFCVSLEQLNAEQAKKAKLRVPSSLKDRVKTFTSHPEYKQLQASLKSLFKDMDNLELQYRSELFRDLRLKYKNWYQYEFVSKFKAKYPYEPMSQPMVSRLENMSYMKADFNYITPLNQRRKPMDLSKAKKIANTYGVDLGLFLPALISSSY